MPVRVHNSNRYSVGIAQINTTQSNAHSPIRLLRDRRELCPTLQAALDLGLKLLAGGWAELFPVVLTASLPSSLPYSFEWDIYMC